MQQRIAVSGLSICQYYQRALESKRIPYYIVTNYIVTKLYSDEMSLSAAERTICHTLRRQRSHFITLNPLTITKEELLDQVEHATRTWRRRTP